MKRKKTNFGSFTNEELMERSMAMMVLVQMGVTPEEYSNFFNMNSAIDDFFEQNPDLFTDEPDDDNDDVILAPFHGRRIAPMKPLVDADQRSLVLKVQMQGVKNPPMWRELVVPADFNFTQLHFAIQAAVGLCNCHLWQFQRAAYQNDLAIGIPIKEEYGFGIDECTDDADTTPITSYLTKKGDKLVYVYDFGDDWIFDVKVKDIIDRAGEVAECRKKKSNLQAIENIGGVWAYTNIREAYENREKLTAKQKKEMSDNLGFENFNELMAVASDAQFDAVLVSEQLSNVPDFWPDDLDD